MTQKTMTVQEAIAGRLAKIQAAKDEAARLVAMREAAIEEARQRWIVAMRERIKAEYGIVVTDDEVNAWKVVSSSGTEFFSFSWHFAKGAVTTQTSYNIHEVAPGPESSQLQWWAKHDNQGHNCKSLVTAIVYATTGEFYEPRD